MTSALSVGRALNIPVLISDRCRVGPRATVWLQRSDQLRTFNGHASGSLLLRPHTAQYNMDQFAVQFSALAFHLAVVSPSLLSVSSYADQFAVQFSALAFHLAVVSPSLLSVSSYADKFPSHQHCTLVSLSCLIYWPLTLQLPRISATLIVSGVVYIPLPFACILHRPV
jgi:hypothetical protein